MTETIMWLKVNLIDIFNLIFFFSWSFSWSLNWSRACFLSLSYFLVFFYKSPPLVVFWSVGWLVGRSVCRSLLNWQGSHISMLLSELLVLLAIELEVERAFPHFATSHDSICLDFFYYAAGWAVLDVRVMFKNPQGNGDWELGITR